MTVKAERGIVVLRHVKFPRSTVFEMSFTWTKKISIFYGIRLLLCPQNPNTRHHTVSAYQSHKVFKHFNTMYYLPINALVSHVAFPLRFLE